MNLSMAVFLFGAKSTGGGCRRLQSIRAKSSTSWVFDFMKSSISWVFRVSLRLCGVKRILDIPPCGRRWNHHALFGSIVLVSIAQSLKFHGSSCRPIFYRPDRNHCHAADLSMYCRTRLPRASDELPASACTPTLRPFLFDGLVAIVPKPR